MIQQNKNEVLIRTDGEHSITEMVRGLAAETVADLIDSGAVTVNGAALEGGDISINGAKALWKNEDGTWSWRTHIILHGENLNYEEAALGFVCGMSKLRGPCYVLTYTDDKVVGIDFSIWDACFAETVSTGEEYTTITVCGAGDGSMNRTDPSTICFPNALVECDCEGELPTDQCVVLYQHDKAGWHLKRADSRQITLPFVDGEIVDTRINLEYSRAWNRPSQPVLAFGWMELDYAQVIQWFYCDGITCGVSHVDARTVLGCAIDKAEDTLRLIVVSASGDGSDVEKSKPWVPQEYHDVFARTITNAQNVYAEEGLLNSQYEQALYGLCLAYGGDGSHYGRGENVFADGIGLMTFAKSHSEYEV